MQRQAQEPVVMDKGLWGGGPRESKVGEVALVAAARLHVEGGVVSPQLGQRRLDVAFLLFQELDLRQALFPAQVQVGRAGVALVRRDQFANFAQRETEPLALKNKRQAFPVLIAVI